MNWNLLGHEWAVSLLKEHIVQEQVRHAYLLTGPQGVGRRTLALRFAQALNCLQPPEPGEFCGQCRACVQFERAQHPDLALVQAEQQGGILRVDQVRDLQRSLSLAPYQARYRVALLLRFEEANANAMNALLKTLEEPAPQVLLLLTAESAESLLPTIVSRCEVLRLRPLPVDQVDRGLQEHWGLAADQAQLLAHISAGRPGFAVQLFQQPDRLEQRHAWLDVQMQMLAAGKVERFAYAESLAKDKDIFRQVLMVWLAFWRDVMLAAAGASTPFSNPDHRAEIQELAERCGLYTARRMVTALERTQVLLDRNINARLAAEVLMLDLPHR